MRTLWRGLRATTAMMIGSDTKRRFDSRFCGLKVYETTLQALPAEVNRPGILVLSKTKGHRHREAIPAASKLFRQIAAIQSAVTLRLAHD